MGLRVWLAGIFLLNSVSPLSAAGFNLPDVYDNPISLAADIRRTFEDKNLSRAQCIAHLHQIATQVPLIEILKMKDALKSTDWVPHVHRDLHLARIALRERLANYAQAETMRFKEVNLFREAHRYLRGFDEGLAFYTQVLLKNEWRNGPINFNPKKNLPNYSDLNVFINPALKENFKKVDTQWDLESGLQSGDIFVVRGSASVSATIARIPHGAEGDGQASHVFVIYKDDSGVIHASESHIEDGWKNRDFDFLKKQYARFGVYRPKNQEVAKRGAQLLFEAVEVATKSKIQLRYNFSMKQLPLKGPYCGAYCSQVASFMMALGASSKSFPTFPSLISMKEPWLLSQLNIANSSKVFAPSDAEIDPALDFVLETREPYMAHQAFLADLILSHMFEKMEEGYVIVPDWKAKVSKHILLPYRRIVERMPFLPGTKEIKSRFPDYMLPSQVEVFVALDSVFSKALSELNKIEWEYMAKNEVPMSPREVKEWIAGLFESDEWLREHFDRP